MPNVNFARGASRARYFQIRGIGETGQFIAPLNPSVGTIIDHVDFSGIATVSTSVRCTPGRGVPRAAGHAVRRQRAGWPDQCHDQRSNEGAGCRRYGRSAATTIRAAWRLSVRSVVRFDGRQARGAAVRQRRLRAQSTSSISDNTNNYDELTVRAKAALAGERRYLVRFRRRVHRRRQRLRRVFARQLAQHDLGSTGQRHAEVAFRQRHRDVLAAEVVSGRNDSVACRFGHRIWLRRRLDLHRLRSERLYLDRPLSPRLDDVVCGSALHLERRRSAVRRLHRLGGRRLHAEAGRTSASCLHVPDAGFHERIPNSARRACSGRPKRICRDATNLTVGLARSNGTIRTTTMSTARNSNRTTTCGAAAWRYHIGSARTRWCTAACRAATNPAASIPTARSKQTLRQFDPETLYNAEVGVKGSWRDDTLVGRLALFYMWRDDMQVDTSQVRARGRTALRSSSNTPATPRKATTTGSKRSCALGRRANVELFGASDCSRRSTAASSTVPVRNSMDASRHTRRRISSSRARNTIWPSGWFARAAVEGKDAYYFSDTDSFQSKPYELLHFSCGTRADNWGITAGCTTCSTRSMR